MKKAKNCGRPLWISTYMLNALLVFTIQKSLIFSNHEYMSSMKRRNCQLKQGLPALTKSKQANGRSDCFH